MPLGQGDRERVRDHDGGSAERHGREPGGQGGHEAGPAARGLHGSLRPLLPGVLPGPGDGVEQTGTHLSHVGTIVEMQVQRRVGQVRVDLAEHVVRTEETRTHVQP
ncbi:hypothetical protein [Ornithinimicrobium kibberense]|uniref:hypothetical protein n=1 Tax=Ornithinimicrobium kibberense TaxID=282060 RepID=UPI0036201075